MTGICSHLPAGYTIYCDESLRDGPHFSNFYGGVLVSSSDRQPVVDRLDAVKKTLNLFGEAKWEKVTERYLGKYVELVTAFFQEVRQGQVRVRVMFRQNTHAPVALTQQQRENAYFLLYYQFIKHAFALDHAPSRPGGTRLTLLFDQFPDTREKAGEFRQHLLRLGASPRIAGVNLFLTPDDIAEVRSHEHVLLQCLDIVMGAMAFRLNDMHKQKLPGSRRRGKRTRAKEALYKHILREICTIHPRFNIGISTGPGKSWDCPYAHWRFIPARHEYREEYEKKQKTPPNLHE